jgi:hypothetical protein
MIQTHKSQPIVISPLKASSTTVANSPRTTSRKLMSTGLTESIRKNLLSGRQQKSQTANAFLNRSRNTQPPRSVSWVRPSCSDAYQTTNLLVWTKDCYNLLKHLFDRIIASQTSVNELLFCPTTVTNGSSLLPPPIFHSWRCRSLELSMSEIDVGTPGYWPASRKQRLFPWLNVLTSKV